MKISGKNKPNSVAYRSAGDTHINVLDLSDAFIGLIHYPNSKIDLGKLIISGIGGDCVNLKGGDLSIESLVIRGSKAWKSYDEYHQDCLQGYSVKDDGYTLNLDGIISNITIKNIDIDVSGFEHQVFMLSDGGFTNWNIGTESIKIRCDYPYWFVANTLSNSIIGNCDDVDIQFNSTRSREKFGKPKIRIGDGIIGSKYCIKSSVHATHDVVTYGCGQDNLVPLTIKQN